MTLCAHGAHEISTPGHVKELHTLYGIPGTPATSVTYVPM